MGAMLQKSLFVQLVICFLAVKIVEAWIVPQKFSQVQGISRHTNFQGPTIGTSNSVKLNSRLYGKKSNGKSDVENSLGCFNFLKNELDFSDDDLTRILINNPNLLYLKVDEKLKPAIDVLKGFEFSLPQIKGMIKKFPSILAYDFEWSIPERLMSLRSAFHISALDLPHVVSAEPVLLVSSTCIYFQFDRDTNPLLLTQTASVKRNEGIAYLLMDTFKITPQQLGKVLVRHPKIASFSAERIAATWECMTELYGMSEEEARYILLRYPYVINYSLLDGLEDRLLFFTQDLGLPPPPFEDTKRLILAAPSLISCNAPSIRKTVSILKTELALESSSQVQTIFRAARVLAYYNPITITNCIRRALYFLTNDPQYAASNNAAMIEELRQTRLGSRHFPDHYNEEEDNQYRQFKPWAAMSQGLIPLDSRFDNGQTAMVSEDNEDYELNLELVLSKQDADDDNQDQDEGDDQQEEEEEENESGLVASKAGKGNSNGNSSGTVSKGHHLDMLSFLIHSSDTDIDSSSSYDYAYANATAAIASQSGRVNMTHSNAIILLKRSPLILTFSPVRLSLAAKVLAVTLAMTPVELGKVGLRAVRVFAMGIETKVTPALSLLAESASLAIAQGAGGRMLSASIDIGYEDSEGWEAIVNQAPAHHREAMHAHRNHPIRKLLRRLIVRYPQTITASLNHLAERLAIRDRFAAPWAWTARLIQFKAQRLQEWMDRAHAIELAHGTGCIRRLQDRDQLLYIMEDPSVDMVTYANSNRHYRMKLKKEASIAKFKEYQVTGKKAKGGSYTKGQLEIMKNGKRVSELQEKTATLLATVLKEEQLLGMDRNLTAYRPKILSTGTVPRERWLPAIAGQSTPPTFDHPFTSHKLSSSFDFSSNAYSPQNMTKEERLAFKIRLRDQIQSLTASMATKEGWRDMIPSPEMIDKMVDMDELNGDYDKNKMEEVKKRGRGRPRKIKASITTPTPADVATVGKQ